MKIETSNTNNGHRCTTWDIRKNAKECIWFHIEIDNLIGERGGTHLCGRTADDSGDSRATGVDNKKESDSKDEEAHSSGDRINSVVGDDRVLGNVISGGACYIKGQGTNNEGANSHGDRGAANFESCNKRGSGSHNEKAHGLGDGKGKIASGIEELEFEDEIEYCSGENIC